MSSKPYQIHSLAHARKYMGKSQGEVAKAIGFSQSAVSRMENKLFNELNPEDIKRFLEALSTEDYSVTCDIKTANDKITSVFLLVTNL